MAFEIGGIRRKIHKIISTLEKEEKISQTDITVLERPIGRLARNVMKKEDYYEIRSFCAGLVRAFAEADKLAKFDIFEEAMIPINNIRLILSKMFGEEKEKFMKEDFAHDIPTLKSNIKDLLDQLAAALETKVKARIAA